jgi:hypothetical protein
LSLCTLGLVAQVARCKVTDVYKGLDYRLIKTEFIIGNPICKDLKPTIDFCKIDIKAVEDKAK